MNSICIKLGAFGGLLGGVVFGMMMGTMGMLPMIGQMVGQPNAVAGFGVHLINSVIIGAGFALVFGRFVSSIGSGLSTGLFYGGVWWLLGPLTLMPLFLGMGFGVNWNIGAAQAMAPSLVGHFIYGAILGVSYHLLGQRSACYAVATAS